MVVARHPKHTGLRQVYVDIKRANKDWSYRLGVVVATVVRVTGTREAEATVLATLSLEPVGTGHGAVSPLGVLLANKEIPSRLHGSINKFFLLN